MKEFVSGNVRLLNIDCMEYMATVPDKYFDLAIVDPPYGIERFKKASGATRFKSSKLMQEEGLTWDNKPGQKYWDELFRVSKNQIVWGANNFTLPPSEYFLIWDKRQTVDNFAAAEYAWVSMGLKKPAKIFVYSIHQHNSDAGKIHPTQKPRKLYDWLLTNYSNAGQKILDTHLGSASSAISAHYFGLGEFVGCELDSDYFQASVDRFKIETAQETLF